MRILMDFSANISKKQDLTEIKPSLIRDKALILNQRPRKCLNWESPFEVYFDISLHLN